jgi:hypothetical protein
MIGWSFDIYRQEQFKSLPARAQTPKGERIASWSADIGGFEWLEKLVENKNAICLQEGFYPGLYTIKAKHIFCIIQNMPPHVKIGINWVKDEEKGYINCGDLYYFWKLEKEIVLCREEEWLIVEICDLS